jgi:phosphoglycolate phosphatase
LIESSRDRHRLLTVFDLDGTLVDSSRDLAESANELVESFGGSPLAQRDIVRMVGDGVGALVKRVLAAANVAPSFDDALARYLAIYDRRMLNHTRPYDGIPAAVVAATKFGPCAVLTNKPSQPTRRILDAFGLTLHFIAIVGGDDGFPRKPEPEGLRHIMREAGVEPNATVMVGDSLVDVQVGRRALTSICIARFGFGFEGIACTSPAGDELYVDHAVELPGVLEMLSNRQLGTEYA